MARLETHCLISCLDGASPLSHCMDCCSMRGVAVDSSIAIRRRVDCDMVAARRLGAGVSLAHVASAGHAQLFRSTAAQFFLTGLGRLIWYVLITLCFCYPVELTSVAVGMMVTRRHIRILWGLTPQMLIVFGLVGFANVICTQELLTSQSGFVASFPDPLWYGLHAASQLGAITFTVWWTRWVLARAATDRWVETVAAESQAMQSTPRKGDE